MFAISLNVTVTVVAVGQDVVVVVVEAVVVMLLVVELVAVVLLITAGIPSDSDTAKSSTKNEPSQLNFKFSVVCARLDEAVYAICFHSH